MLRPKRTPCSGTGDVLVVINPKPRANDASAVSVGKFMNILPRSVERIWLASAGFTPSMFALDAEVITGSPKRGRGPVGSFLAQLEACRVVRHSGASSAFFWIADTMVLPFLYCKLRGVRVFNYVIGDWEYFSSLRGLENRVRNGIRRMMALQADLNLVESSHVLDNWAEVRENTKVEVAPLYVESDVFRQCVPMAERGNRVGLIGRLAESKNVMEALKGFDDFAIWEGDGWELIVVGEGPMREDVEAYALNSTSRIRVLGWQPREEVAGVLNSCKCLLMPTLCEGLPNTLLEAMTCGTPALATPVGGINDLVFEGRTGWLLEGSDASHIAAGLRKAMVRQSESLEEISAAAKLYVDTHYSLEASRKKINDILQWDACDSPYPR